MDLPELSKSIMLNIYIVVVQSILFLNKAQSFYTHLIFIYYTNYNFNIY